MRQPKFLQRTRKGQSAIEYLTTYGWMLLVIAIVGGAIFSTVQNSAQIQSVSGLTNADVQVSDYGLNDNGLQLSLRAAASDQVEIQKIEIKDGETGITADISPDEVVALGDTAQVNLEDAQSTETSDTFDMEITYNTGSLEGLTAEGQITGSFGVFNRISLEEAKFNRSTNELQIDVKNTGDNTTDSISYTVEANNTDYTGSLSNLDAGETSQINISTDETYPLESVNLDTEGTQFIDSSSGLKCTPTDGLVGYWTFNKEQTKNGWAVDLSGHRNNGSINGAYESREGIVGDALFDTETFQSQIVMDSDKGDELNPDKITVTGWFKDTDNLVNYIFRRPNTYSFNNNNANVFNAYAYGKDQKYRLKDFNSPKPYTWNFISMTYDGDILQGFVNMRMFNQEDTIGSMNKNSQNFKIAGYSNNGNPNGGYFDEFRVYNRSLPQEEIQRLYEVRSEDWAVSGCKLTG